MSKTVTVALLCDTHLPLLENTPPYDTFDRAAEEAKKADYLFTLGDITAHGNKNGMEYFVQKMKALDLPWAAVPGNAELRDAETVEEILEMIASPLTNTTVTLGESGWKAVLLDSASADLSEKERAKLKTAVALLNAGERLAVMMHHAPLTLTKECQAFLKDALSPVEAERILIVHGHKHVFGRDEWEGYEVLKLQALDPDKAIGTPPGYSILTFSPDGWTEEDRFFEPSKETVRDILTHLGLSCFALPKDLDYATEHGITAIELRAGNMLDLPEEELLGKIADWRASGGKYLSLHATEPGWKNGNLVRAEEWLDSARWAKKIGADAITLHVPKTAVGLMKKNSPVWEDTKELILKGLSELPENCDIHIENMHMNPGEADDENRRFGYLPDEVADWIDTLREGSIRPEKITFLLDVGHARNNPPYSSVYTMSMWYALMGKRIDACHMHQIVRGDGSSLLNHHAITDLYGPMLNFTGFIRAWETGMIRPRTIFLEVRSLENYITSYDTWQKFCQ